MRASQDADNIRLNAPPSPDGTALIYGGENNSSNCSSILQNVYTGCADGNANVSNAEKAVQRAKQVLSIANAEYKSWPEKEEAINKKYKAIFEAKTNAFKERTKRAKARVKNLLDTMCIYYQPGACYKLKHACCGYCHCDDQPKKYCSQSGFPGKGGISLFHTGSDNGCDDRC